MIDAQRSEAIEWNVADKGLKGLAQYVEAAIEIEMLGIDVGDDRDRRRQSCKGAVALVGLDHHPIARSQAGVGAVSVDDAAIDHSRVELRGLEQRADHRSRRGLAVGPGDCQRPFKPHQLSEHFGAPNHRQAAHSCRYDLRIVVFDRGGDNDDLCRAQILGIMSDCDRDPEIDESPYVGAVRKIAALDPIAEIVQHLGNTTNADPADADEMERADRLRKRLHAAHPGNSARSPGGSRSRASRARRWAASRRPKLPARCAAADNAALSANKPPRREARASGVTPHCGMTQPPPASAKARAFAV